MGVPEDSRLPLPMAAVFAGRPDPRRPTANTWHRPADRPVPATCGVLAGAASRDAIAASGRAEEAFVRRVLARPHGIPSADTFARAFAELDSTPRRPPSAGRRPTTGRR